MHDTRKHDGILWLVVAIICLVLTDMAHAEGTQFEVGTERTARWDAVTARENGRATTGAITYNVYHGTSNSDLTLVRESVTGTVATGIPTVEGQNYVGVVAVEAGNTAGPSPMSALFPFEGVVPDSRPTAPVVRSLE